MHKLALLMKDIARAIVIGIIVLVTIMTVLKMAINDISEFFKKIARRRGRNPNRKLHEPGRKKGVHHRNLCQ